MNELMVLLPLFIAGAGLVWAGFWNYHNVLVSALSLWFGVVFMTPFVATVIQYI